MVDIDIDLDESVIEEFQRRAKLSGRDLEAELHDVIIREADRLRKQREGSGCN